MSDLDFPVVLILLPTRRQPTPETQECLDRIPKGVALIAKLPGCSDVTLARNILLTRAMQVLEATPSIKGVLFVDDDIVFTVEDLGKVMSMGAPAAAAYGHGNGEFACTHMPNVFTEGKDGERIPLFWCGLGFAFIPRFELYDLAQRSISCKGPGGVPVTEFTRSCAGGSGQAALWLSEDYFLCNRLGGFQLVTTVGHVKPTVLRPSPESFEALIAPRIGGQ